MGKDEIKEDSGFGFKDKAKAEETLRLLESHELQYRRLTVRGLLGRAKRVLSLTKAEEKIKNIKEAMAVFEEWLQQQGKDKNSKDPVAESKSAHNNKSTDNKTTEVASSESEGDVEMGATENKKDKSPPPPADTVPGLGFKDAAAAHATLRALEGRDPDYQKLAVKGLVGRAKRVLTCTKDESKVNNIKEAMAIFDKYLDDFETQHRSKDNNAYLPLAVVEGCYRLAIARGIDLAAYERFVKAYRDVRGEYKRLRTVMGSDDVTWDILRNRALGELKQKHSEAKLFDAAGDPSDAHVELILWAYSPEATRVKKINFPLPPSSPSPPSPNRSAGAGEGTRKRRASATTATAAADSAVDREDDSPSKRKK